MESNSYLYGVAALSNLRALVLRASRDYTKPNILQLWDLASGERLHEFSARSRRATKFAAGDAVAVSGDSKGILHVWSLPDGTFRRSIDTQRDARDPANGEVRTGPRNHTQLPVTAITLLDAGRRALVATGDGSFSLWDLDSGERMRDFHQHGLYVDGFAVLRTGRRFLCAAMDRSVRLWDTRTGACRRTFLEAGLPPFKPHLDARDPQCPTDVCVLPDDRRMVSVHGDGLMRCWNLKTGKLLHKVRTSNGPNSWLISVNASAQAGRVIAGGWDHNVWMWEPGGEPVAMQGHIGEVMGAEFLPGFEHAVSASFDQTIRVWDVASHTCVRVIGRPVYSSQFPPSESRW